MCVTGAVKWKRRNICSFLVPFFESYDILFVIGLGSLGLIRLI